MGHRRRWDTNSIKHNLWEMAYECSSVYNDGFTQFEVKKELIAIKFLIDDLLSDLPKFTGEEDLYQQRLMDKLK